MIVNSHNQEFGYELLSAVPYAYELHLRGELTGTISGVGSEPLYYFSPDHKINPEQRSFDHTQRYRNKGLPYSNIHEWERPKLTFPPYKAIYANDVYKWEKPTLVIANRYNREWSREPINFFDRTHLEWLFDNLKDLYEIVYIAVDIPDELNDGVEHYKLNDRDIAKKHGVKVFQDIKGECWNTSLLQVFANCEHFITMNGGYSILASFFTGTNIAYTRKRGYTSSSEYKLLEFDRWYPNHNNQRTIGVYNELDFFDKVKAVYIDRLPTVNVIIRTAGRPVGFRNALNSILEQDYENVNIVVTTDDRASAEYTRGYKVRHIDCSDIQIEPVERKGQEYGIPFKYNLYLNRVLRKIDGYVLYLDDDDMFTRPDAISLIMEGMSEDILQVHKYQLNGQQIPSRERIKLFDISGVCLCHHSKYAGLTDWSEWKRADYRTAKRLSQWLDVKYLNETLVMSQNGVAGIGKKLDVNLNYSNMETYRFLKDRNVFKKGDIRQLSDVVAELYLEDSTIELLHPPKVKKEEKAPIENKEEKTQRTTKAKSNVRSGNTSGKPKSNKSGSSKSVPKA